MILIETLKMKILKRCPYFLGTYQINCPGFEVEGNNTNKYPQEGDLRNPNQFRRPFNPQMMRRERRNEEYPFRPLSKPIMITI
jgi:hypothetical protein